MLLGFRLLVSAALLLLLLQPGSAPAHPVVPGFERFYANDKGEAARGGRLLLSELGCVACHAPADATLTRKTAPVLDNVGSRVRIAALRRFIADPHTLKPGTTMPDLLAGDPDRDQKVEALVHFLATTGSTYQERPQPKSVAAGRDHYSKVGCVACHGSRKANGEADRVLPTSAPLGDLAAKYTIPALAKFLEDPLHTRPAGRMPRLLNAKEAKEVASFLLQSVKLPTGGKGSTLYSYYEGEWPKLPDFAKLKPAATGVADAFDIGVARRDSNYALRFEGVVELPRDGDFTFTLTSDDGSCLYIDGKLVVDNDGIHAPQAKTGKARLTKGIHKIVVTFMQGGGGAELDVTIEGSGVGKRPLAELAADSEESLKKKPVVKLSDEDFDLKPQLAAKGKALFASLGCASCHSLKTGGKLVESTLQAKALEKLTAGKGCLAEKPAPGSPRYALSAKQMPAIEAALMSKAPTRTPATVISDTMVTLNCYACHVRDKVGGPLEELNKLFLTTQPEMGDEGRLPPPLDGVGAKLQTDYFKHILDKGTHDRPYMHTRMPGFGLANAGAVVDACASLDKLAATPAVAFKEPTARVKARARHLVSGMAFGCVKCHTFAGKKAEGVQGIDMILMPKRVQRDWFHAYISDPQRIRPGTRMPAAFMEGKSVLPDILDGTALTQIEAMWQYLEDGPKAMVPPGMGKAFIPLTPITSAIIYRNFIEGAGSRAIAVGYPEKAHLTFDANELRLALLWHGGFIDAARHWTDRGAGNEPPLGDDVLRLPNGVSFALLDSPDAAWPSAPAKKLGFRFKGYRLTTDDRPTFLYSLNEIRIEDFPNPSLAGKDVSMRRAFTLNTEQPINNLYYRAAAGIKIESLADGWYRVDGTLKVKLTGGDAKLRKANGKMELLVPVRFKDGKAQLAQEYVW